MNLSVHLYPPNTAHTSTKSIFSKLSHIYETNERGQSNKFCPVSVQQSADAFLFMDFKSNVRFHVFPQLLSQLRRKKKLLSKTF